MSKVLIAEDNVDNTEILTDLLGDEGYDVISAGNAADVVSAAKIEQPDLILMDLQMPDSAEAVGLNNEAGLEATLSLRSDPDTRSIPIIALTGYDTIGLRAEIEAAGCDAIGAKPYEFAALLKTVADLIARS